MNGIEIGRFTVFYKCEGVEKIIDVLKNVENAVVDDCVIDEMSEAIMNAKSENFKFNLKVRMRYGDFILEFEDPVVIHIRIVEKPDYIAISTTPYNVRVVAEFKMDDIRRICEEIARHIPKALNLKNAVDFIDIDEVRRIFNEKIDKIGLSGDIVSILRDFTELVLKDFEDRIVICRDCSILRNLQRFRCVVFVIECPTLLDRIVERVRLGRLSGRELRRIGIDRSSVIKPKDFVLHMLKVIE